LAMATKLELLLMSSEDLDGTTMLGLEKLARELGDDEDGPRGCSSSECWDISLSDLPVAPLLPRLPTASLNSWYLRPLQAQLVHDTPANPRGSHDT
jgi:hypothetical protein